MLPRANQLHLSMVDSKCTYSRLAIDECGTLWFQMFMSRCQKRMEIIWKSNTGLSLPLLFSLLGEAETNIDEASTEETGNLCLYFTTYMTIAYVVSLQGNEGLLLDMSRLIKH